MCILNGYTDKSISPDSCHFGKSSLHINQTGRSLATHFKVNCDVSSGQMNINKIAIIGGGPSGLVTLNELLHTSKDGTSTIQSFEVEKNRISDDPAFEKIVVFEQGQDIGGVWKYSEERDPSFPKCDPNNYHRPEFVSPAFECPPSEELKCTSREKPFCRDISSQSSTWTKSGIYKHLFTNVPNNLMRFSSGLDIEIPGTASHENPYYPFVTHQQVLQYLEEYTRVNNLREYIRFNSTVVKLHKVDGKWRVTVLNKGDESSKDKWYIEDFDAVVLATGRFNIPFVPYVEGMCEYNESHPTVISHTKAYREVEEYRGKKVLVVGSSISAIDLLQYLIPAAREVWVASDRKVESGGHVKEGQWIHDILSDENAKFHRCRRIQRIHTDGGVEFTDGSIQYDFEKILFATGYHLSYPFLDVPENAGKEYIRILSGKHGSENHAQTKSDGLFMHTFSVVDPTLAFVGIAHNPLIFLTSEANAMAISGVWSGSRELPPVAEQVDWCAQKLDLERVGLQMIDENDLKDFIDEIYSYAPKDRVSFSYLIKEDEVERSRHVLKDLFYDYTEGRRC